MKPWVVLYNPNDIVYQAITGPTGPGPPRHRTFRRILNAAFTLAQIYFWLRG